MVKYLIFFISLISYSPHSPLPTPYSPLPTPHSPLPNCLQLGLFFS
ncbi:MAG: hypothetical protein KME64_38240 [Scytonematopsis contorta HA4267-MV1]|nr:hypothetical protein [Scytonematopsis contorta HA4267-MV1]